tara:strand:- start:3033 stop:3251 length:219 start_codon:yes stop_codon:yes gene_type:complete
LEIQVLGSLRDKTIGMGCAENLDVQKTWMFRKPGCTENLDEFFAQKKMPLTNSPPFHYDRTNPKMSVLHEYL